LKGFHLNLVSTSAATVPLLFDAGMVIFAMTIALWLRPWRILGHRNPPWAWLAACATMPVLWCADRLVGVSSMPMMSLAPLLVLLAGWPLAVLALLPVGVVAALTAHLGLGEALHRLVWIGLVPATLTLGLGAASRRWLPKHIVIYIFGRGFFGVLVATAVAGAATLLMQTPPITVDFGGRFVARLLMSVSEAAICGFLVASLVIFRPALLATYADRLYLPR
jgi:uncharacterized membrane protein